MPMPSQGSPALPPMKITILTDTRYVLVGLTLHLPGLGGSPGSPATSYIFVRPCAAWLTQRHMDMLPLQRSARVAGMGEFVTRHANSSLRG
jgi:hypothetical protein